METIQPEQLTLAEAQTILGKNIIDMPTLSQGYSCLIEEAVKKKSFNREFKQKISAAYRKLAEGICEFQIEKDGEFKPIVDFSLLDGVVVFPNAQRTITGVEPCKACSGLGERIKFHKKPIKVQCLKCKTSSYELQREDEETNETIIEQISVDNEIVLVNGEDKTDDPKYKRLLGRVVEDCLSCNGTGRYITEPEPDLRINVECKTCHGVKYHPDNEKSQILTKCKTCKGKRVVKIPVLSPKVKSTTLCRVCSGMGFIKPAAGPDNPVLTKDLAATIKSL